jgi:hypothetical protein
MRMLLDLRVTRIDRDSLAAPIRTTDYAERTGSPGC